MSKSAIAICTVGVIGWAVVAFGQTNVGQAGKQREARRSSSTMRFVGCLEQGTTPTTFVPHAKTEPGSSPQQHQGHEMSGVEQPDRTDRTARTQPEETRTSGTAGTSLVGQRITLTAQAA